MLKIRLEGKEKEIENYLEKLKKDEQIEVYNISKVTHKSNEISLYWRCFVEVELFSEETGQNEVLKGGNTING